MTTESPVSYDEIADVIGNLPLLVRETRRRRGLSLRAAAAEIGMDNSTLYRIECGKPYTSNVTVDLIRWVGR